MNYLKGILFYALSILAVALFVWSMSGCDAAKQQQKGWNKFVKYGGKIDTVKQTVTVPVYIKGKDGKDSLIYVEKEIDCPEPKIEYKDRWHVRRLDKRERDSLKHVEKMAKIHADLTIDSLNKVIKIERQKKGQARHEAKEAKNAKSGGWSNPWIWVIIGAMVITAIYLIKKQ
jgi:hypothetical protein